MNQANRKPVDPKQMWESQVFKHDRQLVGCAFSPCGEFVLAGGFDNRVHCWNLATAKQLSFDGHASWIRALAFLPDKKRLISADYVGKVICRDYTAPGSKPLWSIDDAHTRYIRSICISRDGKFLVTAGDDRIVRVWNPENGKPIHKLDGHDQRVYSTAFHPNGKHFVSGDRHGTTIHWDAASGKKLRKLNSRSLWTAPSLTSGAGGAGVLSLAFDDSGSTLACSGVTEMTDGDRKGGHASVQLFNWKTGKLKRTLKAPKAGFAERALFHPAGYVIAACLSQDSGSIQFWRPDNEATLHHIKAPWKGCRDLALHPGGERIAVVQWERHGKAGNNPSTKTLEEYKWHHGTVRIYNLTAKPAKTGQKKSA